MSDPAVLTSRSGLRAEINANGAVRRLECQGTLLTLFIGNEIEGGLANVYLRRFSGSGLEWTPLLGPSSPTRFNAPEAGGSGPTGFGSWLGIEYFISLVLAQEAPAWFWHVQLKNTLPHAQRVDLTYTQDVALASYGAIRLNEFYVSQYLDHTPLTHPQQGLVIATRQNQSVEGHNPWSLIGSLRSGAAFATDALQFHGLATRAGVAPIGLTGDLPGRRLQHEHSMAVVRDSAITIEPGANASAGFFGSYVPHHPQASSAADIAHVDKVLALAEAKPPAFAATQAASTGANPTTLFSAAPPLTTLDLDTPGLQALFAGPWRHEETDDRGERLSFFHSEDKHVVLRAKELRVQRPHGHLLRTGQHITPDESALTSTAWMNGVFHSMLTQGHVSINRLLSTVHTYLSLFRSHGQRVFVQIDGAWQLLDVPSAFEISPAACRWVYRHAGGTIEVRSEAHEEPQELALYIESRSGAATRFLISHHIALNGDDGSVPGAARWSREGDGIAIGAAPEGDVGRRFPNGTFSITPAAGTRFEQIGGDELLFADGQSRQQPFICLVSAAATQVGLRIRGNLIDAKSQSPLRVAAGEALIPSTSAQPPAASALAPAIVRLAEMVPWYTHNALVHYLSPRGLEQYSGGGWGTRDVCQGPVEMLLALGRVTPIRDLLLRVMRQQNPDGDWPQWFMFFERERGIRPGDSHGDIVFWPLLVLAQYLIASGDAGVLDEVVPFFDARGPDAGERGTVWQHAQRALALIGKRVIPGTALAAYGHGDWNDSLQPADPSLRDHMCSAWTVTLHFQTLTELAHALRAIEREPDAVRLEQDAAAVHRDFQRLLLVDGVLAGYAVFEDDARPRYLLHPSDTTTGLRYSSLAMIHAILEGMLTPEQVRDHLHVIDAHLSAPDGIRLFDRPMPYHGGAQKIFQRAETATFFGREIGLMYTHAHLRYAQALAHIGAAERFFKALMQANPIAIRSAIPSATLRQANCYYSSSDAAFADRYQASNEYERVADGGVALDGGWRVYSSGAGIALALILRRLFGLSQEADGLNVDPVIPSALDGLSISTTLQGKPVRVQYRIGKAGCGVSAIALNNQPLAFSRRANPYRTGAAFVPIEELREKLSAGASTLVSPRGGADSRGNTFVNVLRIEIG